MPVSSVSTLNSKQRDVFGNYGSRSSLKNISETQFSESFFVCVRSFQQYVEGYRKTSFKHFILGKKPKKQAFGFEAASLFS